MPTDVNAGRIQRTSLFVVSFFLFAPVLQGQQAPLVLPTPEKLLREAYARTKAASREADLTEIIRMCRQARQANPSDAVAAYADELSAWAHNRRGEVYAAQAAQRARQNQQLSPGPDAPLDSSPQATELDGRALADFEAAIELDPRNWKPLHNRGVSRALAGQWDKALEDFSGVVERKPDHANAWFNRGEVRAERGEYELAVADYTQAIELKPEDVDAHSRRGQAYFQLHKFREALADFDRAVQLAPQQAEPLLNRGDAHRSLGQWQLAAEDYRQTMVLDPRLGRAYQSAAWLLATCPLDRYRNAKLAVQAAEKALELDGGEDLRYLDTAAAAYANDGQFEKACETLIQAIGMVQAAKTAPAQAEMLRRRLGLYRRQQPYREPQPTGTAASGF
jgi:tetratricopeptide (TPR) repeat protein